MTRLATDVGPLIEQTRVHGSLYTDPAIYAEELSRIWYRTWVYVGHASEVPVPGNRVAKFLGPSPVDLVRDTAGRVDVVDATGAGLPRVDDRCGFVFASFAADGPDLTEHLGAAGPEIDRLARLSPEGEVELTTGWMKHRTQANWKLLAENETDGYHPQFVHSSVFTATDSPIGALYTERSLAACRDLGNGHSELDLRPEFRRLGVPMGWFGTSESKVADYVATMRRVHGTAAEDILIEGAPHVMVFPNLFIAEVTVFVIQPLAVDCSVQHATAVQLKGAPDLNRRLLQQCVGSVGPAGLLLADDTELYERNQRGLAARTPEWLDLSRGLHRERLDTRGLRTGHATDETAQRGFWTHYQGLMSA